MVAAGIAHKCQLIKGIKTKLSELIAMPHTSVILKPSFRVSCPATTKPTSMPSQNAALVIPIFSGVAFLTFNPIGIKVVPSPYWPNCARMDTILSAIMLCALTILAAKAAYFIVGITNSEPIFLDATGQREVVVLRRV